MTLEPQEKQHIENLMKIIKRTEFKLEGLESIPFSRAVLWLLSLIQDPKPAPSPELKKVEENVVPMKPKGKR